MKGTGAVVKAETENRAIIPRRRPSVLSQRAHRSCIATLRALRCILYLFGFSCLTCCLLSRPALVIAASTSPAQPDRPSVGSAETVQDANRPKVSIQAEDPQSETAAISLSITETPQSSLYLAPSPNSDIARQLWQSRLRVPAGEKQKKQTDQLKRLIEQVRSVRFKSKGQAQPVIDVEPVTQTDRTVSAQKPSGKPEETHVPSQPPHSLPYQPVSEQTVKMLETLSQDPNQLSDLTQSGLCKTSELADILFLSGHLKQASVFYQQAFDHIDSADVTSAEDKAWILFQLGNCLRGADLPAARNAYRQLIAECPNSAWAELAKVWESVIDWYMKDNPLTLVEQRQL
jgi:TolA-binding protein